MCSPRNQQACWCLTGSKGSSDSATNQGPRPLGTHGPLWGTPAMPPGSSARERRCSLGTGSQVGLCPLPHGHGGRNSSASKASGSRDCEGMPSFSRARQRAQDLAPVWGRTQLWGQRPRAPQAGRIPETSTQLRRRGLADAGGTPRSPPWRAGDQGRSGCPHLSCPVETRLADPWQSAHLM